MKNKALKEYLIKVPKNEAMFHMMDCLVHEHDNNQVWSLIEEFRGPGWFCENHEMMPLLSDVLKKVEIQLRRAGR